MAIIYSYPDIGDVQGNDIIVITDADTGNATKSATIDTLSAYIAAQAGAGTVRSFSVDSSSIPGITTVVTNATTDPLLTVSITGTPGPNKYLDGTGNWTTPAGSGGGALTLTTIGTSGAATLVGATLNIPIYSTGGGSGTVESITAVSPLTGGTITTTGSIGINQASGSASGFLSSTDWNTFNSKQSTSEKGQASGYAPLDGNNKVPAVHLPDSLVGAVVYQGTWNASTNIPTLPTPGVSNQGHYYIVSASGVYSGITYAIGDWAISNGTEWQKVDNTQDVNSVFGRQGNVVANQSDYATFYADINDAYSDAKVDLNLNVASANATQILSWSGTDYVWVNQQSGGGGGAVDSVNGQTGVVSLDTDDIPEGSTNLYNIQSDWTAITGAAVILNKPTLATVATTGDYSDLLNTPNLATVATTGSYNDLIDKPTIPGGTNIGSTPSASNVIITSSTGSDGTVAAATQSLAGVMTAADKIKLDGIANNATNYGDSNVNLLLDQANAPDNYVLSWTGQAYTWINQSGGLNSFNVQSDTGGDITVNQTNTSFKISGGTELLTTRTNNDINISLQATGVVPGQYVNPVINIDSKGRITSATGGSGGGSISGSGIGTQMAIFDSTNSITSTNTVAVNGSSQVIMEVLANSTSYVDDAAASAGGVPFAGLYRDGSNVRICLINSGGGEFDPDPFVPTADGTPTFLAADAAQGYLVDKTGAQVTPPNGNITYPFNASNGGFLVSDDLQYIYAYPTNPRTVYRSGNYGNSFQSLGFSIGTQQAYLARAISKNGQYVYIQTDETASGIRFSSDYGNSFSQLSITGVTATFQCTVRTSSGGKFVWITLTNVQGSASDVRILKSFDYGSSFIDVTSLIPQPPATSSNRSIGLSGDGRVVTIYQRDGVNFNSLVYRSLDYGQTFTSLSNANSILAYSSYGIQTNQDGSVVAFHAISKGVNSYNADQTPINYFTLASSVLEVGLSNYGSYGFWQDLSNGSFNYFEQGVVNTNVQMFNNNLKVFNTVNL